MSLFEVPTKRMDEPDTMLNAFSIEGCRDVSEFIANNIMTVFEYKDICDDRYILIFTDKTKSLLNIHLNFPELLYVEHAVDRRLAYLEGRKED